MKIISFSLYGDSPKYIVGMAKNILLAKEHYPDWTCRIYIDEHAMIDRFLSALAVESNKIDRPHSGRFQFRDGQAGIPPMLWRFMVADEPDVERFIVRDADSRISPREAAAVREWEQSGLLFHSMRDHPAHARPMNGGMWGGVWRNHNWEAPKMIDLWKEWVKSGKRKAYLTSGANDEDQGFLNQMVWPWARSSCLQHDSVCRHAYPGSKPFPTKRDWPRFVGEVWDIGSNGEDVPRAGDWQAVPKSE